MEPVRLFVHPAAARERFREIASRSEEELDLGEASLVIALEEYPALSVDDYLVRIDRWGEAVRERVGSSHDVEKIVEEINHLLFEEEGFHGDEGDYYDPRSSFFNEVLDRHAGRPLSLSILYIEISRRAGLPVSGVSLPGRFLVKVAGPFGEILIDPFESGQVLSTTECQQIMDSVFGGAVRLREHHLRSFGKREILARLLAHLKATHLSRRNLAGAAAAIDRLLILDERDVFELRDRGTIAMEMHRYADAIRYLERYLDLTPATEDHERIREQIEWIRAWN